MKPCIMSVSAALTLASAAAAQTSAPAQKPAGGGAPAAYTPVRWNEDYSYLKDLARRADFFDPIKYIPLNEQGDWYLSLGGQGRYRYEFFDNFNFGVPGIEDGDGFHLFRFLGHADLHMTQYFRVFAQVKHSGISDREGGPRATPTNPENSLDRDDLDLQQAFGDIILPIGDKSKVILRGGRQDLIYGAQRIISPLDWTNTRRTFEGGKISVVCPDNVFDLFWVRPIIIDKDDWNDRDDDTDFVGAYDTWMLPKFIAKAGTRFEAFALYLDREAADEERYTVGGRFYTNPKPWDFDIEGAYQFGDSGETDIDAFMLAIEAGYTFDASLTPRLSLGFDISSGDDDPTDGDNETYNQLFPLAHAYQGYIDVVGRQNAIDLHPGLSIKPTRETKLSADYHVFWRYSDADALYAASGAALRPAGTSDERFIGTELDLMLTWQVDRHLSAYVGYSHFWTGEFIEDTGPDEEIDFVYAAVTFTF